MSIVTSSRLKTSSCRLAELSGDNRWIKLAGLILWDELEVDYAAQFCKGFGAPAKPFRTALGALIIKARMALTDTGPWVALLSRNDIYHKWAVEQFRLFPPPLLSCEAVVAETCFLLKRSGFDPSLPLQFIV